MNHLPAVLLLLLLAGTSAKAYPQQSSVSSQQHQFSLQIPAVTLAEALQQLASQTGYALVAADPLPAQPSPAVQGEWTLQAALQQLLATSGLQAQLQPGLILILPLTRNTTAAATNDSDRGNAEHIVVQGKAPFLGMALDEQARQGLAADILFAAELATMPQLNLGDALQSLPGLVAEKDNGQTRQLGLRGLGPEFVQVQINGVDTLASFNSVFDHRGSAERSRNVDFNLFSSTLFQQLSLRKSYQASQSEGGIAGTIELQTAEPLSEPTAKARLGLSTHYNSLSATTSAGGQLALFSGGKQMAGMLLLDYQHSDQIETGYRDWGWRAFNRQAASSLAPDLTALLQSGQLIGPTVTSATLANRQQQRLGLNASWQWQPNADTDWRWTHIAGQLKSTDQEYNLANLQSQGFSALAVDQFGTVRFGKAEHANIRSEAKLAAAQTEVLHSSLAVRLTPQPNQLYRADLSLSQSDFQSPLHDKIFLQAPGHSYSFDFRPHRRSPLRQYDVDLTARQRWQLHRADVREDQLLNQQLQANFSSRFGTLSRALTLGAQLKKFSSEGFERRDDVRDLNILQLPFVSATPAWQLPQPMVVADVDQTFATVLAQGLSGRISGQPFARELTALSNKPGTSFTVQEQQWALYGSYQWTAANWQADAGLRLIENQTERQGEPLPASGQPIAASRLTQRQQHWLPSLQLTVDLSEQWVLRAAASRNLTRPGLSQLRASTEISIADNKVEQGNPELQPVLADALDLSLAYQLDAINNLSLALFHKKLQHFIVTDSQLLSYTALGLPAALLTPDRHGELFTLSKPVNQPAAQLRGLELAGRYQWPQGFGVLAHYSLVSGHSSYPLNQQQLRGPLPGLSRDSGQLSLYWQSPQAGARLVGSYRDQYITDTDVINGFIGVRSLLFVDASAYYQLSNDLRLSLALLNVTDQPIDMFAGLEPNRPLVFTRSGRSLQLGLQLQF